MTQNPSISKFRVCPSCEIPALKSFFRGQVCVTCSKQDDLGQSTIDQVTDDRVNEADLGLGEGHDDLPKSLQIEARVIPFQPMSPAQYGKLRGLGFSHQQIKDLSKATASEWISRAIAEDEAAMAAAESSESSNKA